MFSIFKKPNEPEMIDKRTNMLLDDISRHAELNRRLHTITTNVVNIQNKRDFVEHFKTYLGNPLATSDFIDIFPTKQFKHKSYKYIFSHHQLSEFVDEYNQVITKLKELKSKTMNFYGKDIIVFHDYDSEIGAIKMTLGKFWGMFPKILDVLDAELHHDLLIVSANFSFGICVEIEGINYSMTVWGFDNESKPIQPSKFIGNSTL